MSDDIRELVHSADGGHAQPDHDYIGRRARRIVLLAVVVVAVAGVGVMAVGLVNDQAVAPLPVDDADEQLGEREAEHLRRMAEAWIRGLVTGDDDRLRALTHPDYPEDELAALAAHADRVVGGPEHEIGVAVDDRGLLGAEPGPLVCVRVTHQDTGELVGAVAFRQDQSGWRVSGLRRDVRACAEPPPDGQLADLVRPRSGPAVEPESMTRPSLREQWDLTRSCRQIQDEAGFELVHLPQPPAQAPDPLCFTEVVDRARLYAHIVYVPTEMTDGSTDSITVLYAGGIHVSMLAIDERPTFARPPPFPRSSYARVEVRGELGRVELLGTREWVEISWAEERDGQIVRISLYGTYSPEEMLAFANHLQDGQPDDHR